MRSKSNELKCKALGDGGRQSGDLNSHGQPPKAQHQSASLIPSEERLRHEIGIESRKLFNCKRFGFMYMRCISTCPKEKVEHFDPPEGLVLPLSSIMIVRVSNICSFGPQSLYSSPKMKKYPLLQNQNPLSRLQTFRVSSQTLEKIKSSQSCSSRENEGESWRKGFEGSK